MGRADLSLGVRDQLRLEVREVEVIDVTSVTNECFVPI